MEKMDQMFRTSVMYSVATKTWTVVTEMVYDACMHTCDLMHVKANIGNENLYVLKLKDFMKC